MNKITCICLGVKSMEKDINEDNPQEMDLAILH